MDERPTRADIALRWLVRIWWFCLPLLCGGAVGFTQGAVFVANEIEARFTCEPK